MCFADVEDETGALELVVFPNIFSENKNLLAIDTIVVIRGKVSDKDGELKFLADKILSIEDPNLTSKLFQKNNQPKSQTDYNPNGFVQKKISEQNFDGQTKLLKIKIPKTANPLVFNKLKTVFSKFPGSVPIALVIPDREGSPREIKTNFLVDNTDAFKTELRQLLKDSLKPV